MGFIFYNSSQSGPESNARSEEFLRSIKKYYIEIKDAVKKPKSAESFNINNTNNEVKKSGNTADEAVKDNNRSNTQISGNANNNVQKNEVSNKNTNINKDQANVSKVSNNLNSNTKKDSAISVKKQATSPNNKVADKNLRFENFLVRRGAHIFEYIVLAILIANAFWQFGVRNKNAVIYILFISLFYAVTDEFHQSFVPNRSSEVEDVILDFSGTIVGTSIWYAWQGFKSIVKRQFDKVQM